MIQRYYLDLDSKYEVKIISAMSGEVMQSFNGPKRRELAQAECDRLNELVGRTIYDNQDVVNARVNKGVTEVKLVTPEGLTDWQPHKPTTNQEAQ